MSTGALLLAVLLAPGPARAGDAPRLRILGISHVSFRVSRLEDSRRFYQDFLGLEASIPKEGGGPAPMVVRVNDRQAIELRPGLVASDDRLDHVAFEVDDIDAARRALAAQGVSSSSPADALTMRDTEGHALELVGRFVAADTAARSRAEGGPISGRILHAGIIVGELDVTRRFYEGLGFREIWRGSRSGTELSWTNMQVSDGDDYVEFMLYAVKPAPNERGIQHHICLEVPDVEVARVLLQQRAPSAGYSRPLESRIGTNRRRQLNLYDPDGTRVELMEAQTVDGRPVPSSTAPPPLPSRSSPQRGDQVGKR